jgi:hypothetical protein
VFGSTELLVKMIGDPVLMQVHIHDVLKEDPQLTHLLKACCRNVLNETGIPNEKRLELETSIDESIAEYQKQFGDL